MKHFIVLAFFSSVLCSCSNQIQNDNFGEEVDVRLSLSGDYIEVQGTLQSKASSGDITAVQVYQRSTTAGSPYKPFCYGIWDNSSNISVKLNKGFIYRIETTIVPNAKAFVASSEIDGAMKQPFSVSGSNSDSRINNAFKYSTANYLSYLAQGTTAIKNGKSYNLYTRPNGDRYYGELNEIRVTDDQVTLKLETKRVVFALKYEITGFTEGEVKVNVDKSPEIVLKKEDYQTQQSIITFQGSTFDIGSWASDTYSEFVPIKVYWKKADGTEIEIINNEYNFQRKKLYNLKIDLTKTLNEGDVEIKLEDEEFGNGGDIY